VLSQVSSILNRARRCDDVVLDSGFRDIESSRA
jgi:hypothetical protein